MVTQRDIADRIGVSVSLVSRALNGSAESIGVPAATVQRVRDAAAEMGYFPNISARILKGGQARTFGVVVYDFEDPFFGPLVGELQRLAHEQRFSLVLGGFEKRKVWDLDVRELLKHHIDGLIIIGSGDVRWADPFVSKKIPAVRIGGGPLRSGVHSVQVNDQRGIDGLVQYLQGQGYRRIGFVGADQESHHARAAHFMRAMKRRSQPVKPGDWCFSEARLAEAGYEAGRRLMQRKTSNGLEAIVAGSDLVALGLLRALAEAGRCVPGDIALTGYDDLPAAKLSIPSLTTVRQPVAEMARAAFNWVASEARSAKGKTSFDPALIVRESTRRSS